MSGAPGRVGQPVPILVEEVFKEEKDLVPILILNMEAKSNLSVEDIKTGCDQLQETMRHIKNQFGSKIDDDWKVIRVLYGTEEDRMVKICYDCSPYIITAQDDFEAKMNKITTDNTRAKKDIWIQNFRYLVKELLPSNLLPFVEGFLKTP